MRYRVTFERIGRTHNVPPLETEEVDGPNHLAEKIYSYARPYLMSRNVEVVVEPDADKGFILCGFNNGGSFKVEVTS